MKNKQFKWSVLLLLGFGLTGLQAQHAKKIADLKGDYLGQTPPGETPVVFAPGIVSTENTIEHGAPTFAPDGNEVFWQVNRIDKEKKSRSIFGMSMRRTGGRWTAPEISPYDSGPVFSPDGKRLYFLPFGKEKGEKNGPYFVEKKGNGWGKPKCLGLIARFPELKFAHNLSITRTGTLYFLGHAAGLGSMNDYGIYRAELVDGEYAKPELLPPSVNAPGGVLNWTPFIAPDESYLPFSSNRRSPDTDAGDLFVCFRQPDGSWTDAVSLGATINSDRQERFPAVSPDGKYLFFTRWVSDDDDDVFWVSAGIIAKLKAKAIQEKFLKQRNEKEEIFEAVDAGDLNEVRARIEADPTLLESKDHRGSTPLIRACLNMYTMHRQSEVAKFLIEKGANVNVTNHFSLTPLLAASSGLGPDFDLIKRLIAKGSDVNAWGTNGITPLHRAAQYGDLNVAKLLLDHGADINIYDKYNGPLSPSNISGTVLQVAINLSPNEDMARFLVESGAKLNRKDAQGNTELHLAALKGNADLAGFLAGHGADVNALNGYGRAALYFAAKHGYRGVAEALIAAGANENTVVEANYGKAPQLSETLKYGEAYLWSLGGQMYAVKTKRNLLLFILGDIIDRSPEAGLANGHLNPVELAGQKITVFINHWDRWQMRAKDFGQLAKLVPGIHLVSGFKPDFSKEENPNIPTYRFALPNESFSMEGIHVHTIPALASGSGYLVEVDGVKIFHAGLHISDDELSHVEKFRKEVDFLKPFGPIDIAMLTVHSHSNRVGMDYVHYLYLIDQLAPKAIYLFGANIHEAYTTCADVLRVRDIPVVYPEVKQSAGERFHYLRDRKKK